MWIGVPLRFARCTASCRSDHDAVGQCGSLPTMCIAVWSDATASWSLLHEAVHLAKHSGTPIHIGPIVSTDLFYNPDEGQYRRWSSRGVLGVEMEAAALFTLAAIKGVEAACLLTVSDMIIDGSFARISDDDLRASVDRMTQLALDVATAQ